MRGKGVQTWTPMPLYATAAVQWPAGRDWRLRAAAGHDGGDAGPLCSGTPAPLTYEQVNGIHYSTEAACCGLQLQL